MAIPELFTSMPASGTVGNAASITDEDSTVAFPSLVRQGTVTYVRGGQIALQILRDAFYARQLAVSTVLQPHASQAFEESAQVLMITGDYPTPAMQSAVALDTTDLDLSPDTSVQYAVDPPFNYESIAVDEILATLRANAKVQGGNTFYQLGVLTEVTGTPSRYFAVVLPTDSNIPPSVDATTMWMFRVCTVDPAAWTGYQDLWKSFNFRGSVPSAATSQDDALVQRAVLVPAVQGPAIQVANGVTQSMPAMVASTLALTIFHTAFTPGSWPAGQVATKVQRPYKVGKAKWDNSHLLNGWRMELVADDILNGALHPDNITSGWIMLEIAKIRTNTQLKEALDVLYRNAQGVTFIPKKDGQALTKAITNALKSKAGTPNCKANEPAYLREREAFNAARKANGINYSGMFSATPNGTHATQQHARDAVGFVQERTAPSQTSAEHHLADEDPRDVVEAPLIPAIEQTLASEFAYGIESLDNDVSASQRKRTHDQQIEDDPNSEIDESDYIKRRCVTRKVR